MNAFIQSQRLAKFISISLSAFLVWTQSVDGQFFVPTPRHAALNFSHFAPLQKYSLFEKVIPPSNENQKWLIHILDVHNNKPAQNQIRTILGALIKDNKLDVLVLEGESGELDFSHYAKVPTFPFLEQAANDLYQEDIISGPGYFSLTQAGKIKRLVGAERKEDYLENIESFKMAARSNFKLRRYLMSGMERIRDQRAEFLNASLLSLEIAIEKYRDNQIDLETFLNGISSLGYPLEKTFLSLQMAIEIENHIDPEALLMEVENLKRDLNPERTKYPNLNFQLKSGELVNEVRDVAIAEKVEELIGDVRKKFILNNLEKDFVAMADLIGQLYQLSNFSISSSAYNQILDNKKNPLILSLEAELLPYFNFYDLAKKRDENFYDVVRNELNKHDVHMAVLVSGGFHEKGVSTKAIQDGYGYISLIPKFSEGLQMSSLESLLAHFATLSAPAVPVKAHLSIANKAIQSSNKTGDRSLRVWGEVLQRMYTQPRSRYLTFPFANILRQIIKLAFPILYFSQGSDFHGGAAGDETPQKEYSVSYSMGVLTIEGVGLHTGKSSRIEIEKLPAGSGRHIKVPSGNSPSGQEIIIPVVPGSVTFETRRNTSLQSKGRDGVLIMTTEHLLAALYRLNINDVEIRMIQGHEFPILDGNIKSFMDALEPMVEANPPRREKRYVKHPVIYRRDSKTMMMVLPLPPGETHSRYTHVVHLDELHRLKSHINETYEGPSAFEKGYVDTGNAAFLREIAHVPTFLERNNYLSLQKQGFFQGLRPDQNVMLVGNKERWDGKNLIFKDDPASPVLLPYHLAAHKIGDIIGDKVPYEEEMGAEIVGHYISFASGHRDNAEFFDLVLRSIREDTPINANFDKVEQTLDQMREENVISYETYLQVKGAISDYEKRKIKLDEQDLHTAKTITGTKAQKLLQKIKFEKRQRNEWNLQIPEEWRKIITYAKAKSFLKDYLVRMVKGRNFMDIVDHILVPQYGPIDIGKIKRISVRVLYETYNEVIYEVRLDGIRTNRGIDPRFEIVMPKAYESSDDIYQAYELSKRNLTDSVRVAARQVIRTDFIDAGKERRYSVTMYARSVSPSYPGRLTVKGDKKPESLIRKGGRASLWGVIRESWSGKRRIIEPHTQEFKRLVKSFGKMMTIYYLRGSKYDDSSPYIPADGAFPIKIDFMSDVIFDENFNVSLSSVREERSLSILRFMYELFHFQARFDYYNKNSSRWRRVSWQVFGKYLPSLMEGFEQALIEYTGSELQGLELARELYDDYLNEYINQTDPSLINRHDHMLDTFHFRHAVIDTEGGRPIKNMSLVNGPNLAEKIESRLGEIDQKILKRGRYPEYESDSGLMGALLIAGIPSIYWSWWVGLAVLIPFLVTYFMPKINSVKKIKMNSIRLLREHLSQA